MSSKSLQSDAALKRLAAIDIGTNSVRLIVVEVAENGRYRMIDDEKEVTRLGRGLHETKRMQAEPMQITAEVIARMCEIAEGYGITKLRAVGTSAVREAENREEFLDLVQDRASIRPEVITAEEEARFAYLSVSYAFDIRPFDAAVVDIGGGSTEVVLTAGGVIDQIYPLPIGAVRLTEQLEGSSGPPEVRIKALRKSISRMIRAGLGKLDIQPQIMFGTGGTFTALAQISFYRNNIAPKDDSHPFTLRGYEIKRSEVRHLFRWLSSLSPRARARIPGLSADRAEIIVAGIAIIERLMRHLKVNTLRVHDRGIRDGLILSMIQELVPRAEPVGEVPADRLRVVRQFASACKYDQPHSEHVAGLTLSIYDQLIDQLDAQAEDWAQPEARELLHTAAILHDIGYYINYARHHKHSYHLITHSDLPGFTHRELEVVANIARYHRRARPKLKHPNFAKLNTGDRALVKILSGILRLADGLDRAHSQFVRNVRVEVKSATAWFFVEADADPVVDIWGASRKCRLFERN
ncbi:MAG: Ppx/GppA family phosphatase, partial [Phycisphaerales bacterium]